MSDDPASLRRMTDDELLGVLGSVEPDAPLAEQVKREMQARLADRQALRRGRRGFVYLAAIACWLVLWVGTISVGLDLGQRMVGPQGRDGYLALTGLYGVLLIPLGLACSMLFLWWKRHVFLFLVSAIPVGLAITLWPFLFFWAWG